MNEQHSDKRINGQIVERLLFGMLILQIAFMVYMNLFHCDYTVDFDSSSAFVHEMEMGRQGKLLPDEYSYQTTLDIDSTAILSAVIYRISGNIFLARGLSNCMMIALYFIVVMGIFKNSGVSKTAGYIGMLIFFIPYSLEQLGYCKMMFAGAAFYTVRAFVPVLLYSVIMEQKEAGNKALYIFRTILLFICSFLTGLSSGTYVLMCALAPVVLWECINVFIKSGIKELKSKRTLISSMAIILALAGVITQKMLNQTTRAEDIYMADDKSIFNNIFSAIAGLFTFFDGLTPRTDVKLVSVNFVCYLLNFIVILACLLAFIYCLIRCVKNKKISHEKGYAFCVIAVNAAVFMFAKLTYSAAIFEGRYHLIPMMMVFLAVPEAVDTLLNGELKWTRFQKNTIILMIILILTVTAVSGDVKWINLNDKYFVSESRNIHKTVEPLGVDVAYYVGEDMSLGRCLRAFSGETVYVTLSAEGGGTGYNTYGGSCRYMPGTEDDCTTSIIATPTVYEKLSEDKKNGMILKSSYGDYNVYMSDHNPFALNGEGNQ